MKTPLKPDGSLDIDELSKTEVSSLFEKELDEIHSKTAPADNGPSVAEREAFTRECEQFREALRSRCRESLRSENVTVTKVLWNSVECVFKVCAHDASARHRDYSVEATVGEALAVAELHDRAPLAAVAADCVAKILEAKASYMRRMGS